MSDAPEQDSGVCDEALWKQLVAHALAGRVEEVERLIVRGVNVANSEYEFGCSALHSAANAGHANVVRLLLKHGANVRGLEPGSREPIHDAAMSGDVPTLHALLQAGASPLALDEQKLSIAHYAARAGRMEMLREIYSRGALLRHVSSEDATPLSLAAMGRHEDAARYLVAKGADPDDTLLYLCNLQADRLAEVRFALEQLGANPEYEDSEGWRPAFVAAMTGRREQLELLLDWQAPTQDTLNMTFAFLLRYGRGRLSEVLLSRGADRRIPEIVEQRAPQNEWIIWGVQRVRRWLSSELTVSAIEAAMPAEDAEGAAPGPSKGFTL